jgi:oligopeptidase A
MLGQNLALFAKYKALRDSPEYATLSPATQAHRRQRVRDFRLSGAELPEEQKPRFKESRKSWLALRPSSPRTCSMPPTPTPK